MRRARRCPRRVRRRGRRVPRPGTRAARHDRIDSRAFRFDLNQYLSPYGAPVVAETSKPCVDNVLSEYPGLCLRKLFKATYADPLGVPVIAGALKRMVMGRTGTPREPLLLADGNSNGKGDGLMLVGDLRALACTYCQRVSPCSSRSTRA